VNAVIVSEGDGRWTEYAGGYSDMLAQRGQAVASKKPPRLKAAVEGKATAPAGEAKPGRRRLSFHEKHALGTLPRQIAELQGRVGQLQQRLADPNLYARDREAFAQLSNALAAVQLELTSAEEKWLQLEILREEIESQ
jgi:ATP-binding cassette subfamily F protein uup